jgi:small subunit ribosomal protein S16
LAVKIRLKRLGKKASPFYRIVAIDSRAARNAKEIEVLGTYNPLQNPSLINLDTEKAQKWLKVGATPSDRVKIIFAGQNLISKDSIHKKVKKSKKDIAADKEAATAAIEAAKTAKKEAPKAAAPADAPAAEAPKA